MATCLYCPKDASSSEGKAHVFPEALVQSDLALPPGVVCDPCNNYFGNTLDPSLPAWPTIALAIQFLELPGKTGKPRKVVAGFERPEPGHLRVEVPVPVAESQSSSTGRTVKVRFPITRQLNILKFRRSLHHVALNLVAFEASPSFARRPHFDPVRKYIREPRKTESWPFVIVTPPHDNITPVVQGRRVPEGPGETVCLRIFNLDFCVDLLNRGALVAWATSAFEGDVGVYEPAWKPQIDPPPGKTRYRINLRAD